MVPVTNLHLHVTDHHKKITVIKTIKHGGRLLDIYFLWANKHEALTGLIHLKIQYKNYYILLARFIDISSFEI